MKRFIRFLLLLPVFFPFGDTSADEAIAAGTARGRVRVESGCVLTDSGRLLRGCRISTDWFETLPERKIVTAVKQWGLNAVHLYAESFARHTPGQLHDLVDTLVQWTEEDSLYLVITIGCLMENGHCRPDFTAGFWNYYAPRYAKKTHVLYEIHNEPHAWSPPYPADVVAMEREAYRIIRAAAPETHVLFFSYAVPNDADAILRDIRALGRLPDWSNCSIALHGYGVADKAYERVVRRVRDAGYGVVNTEPRNLGGDVVNWRLLRIHERNNVSYLHFLTPDQVCEPARFERFVEHAGISWTPDFGTWPPALNKPTALDALSRMEAEHFDSQGGPSGVADYGSRIGSISNGDYVGYGLLDFGSGASVCRVRVSSGGAGGAISLRLNAPDGPVIGTVNVDPTGGWDNWVTASCPVRAAAGKRRLFLTFSGGQYDLMDLDWFEFQ
ncbi:MAG: carbohydrate-binding protein [Spirochaetales bacterium]|nr:carbohydrate-binding protein [Spirochaetales bacterium]